MRSSCSRVLCLASGTQKTVQMPAIVAKAAKKMNVPQPMVSSMGGTMRPMMKLNSLYSVWIFFDHG